MHDEWHERWQSGRTGWHEPGGNPGLKAHWRATGRRVLVPFCGKSADLTWLARQGNVVVGVELSEIAVAAFFEEQSLDFRIEAGELPAWQATGLPITVYCGDFFALRSVACDAHYDRGALVALPAPVRPAYAEHVDSLLLRGAQRLVISLDYDDSIATGPPFPVGADELLGYWPSLVKVGSREDIDNGPPKFREAGLTSMLETAWYAPGN